MKPVLSALLCTYYAVYNHGAMAVTPHPSRSPSQQPTNYLNERPTPPTYPTLQPSSTPSHAPSKPTASKRPTYTTRSPTFTKVNVIECPVPVVKTMVTTNNNSLLMYWGADGSALRMDSATITVMYTDGTRVLEAQSFDFGFEYSRTRIVHVGSTDSLRLYTAPNVQQSTLALGYMRLFNGTASITYDPFNGWVNNTLQFIIDSSAGLSGFACTAGTEYFFCVATGPELQDLKQFGNTEFRVFRKIAAPRPGEVVNGTVVNQDPTDWFLLPNYVTTEWIWGNYASVEAVTPPVIAFDGTQEVICMGKIGQFNDTVSGASSNTWTLYAGCCNTKCYWMYNYPYNGQELSSVVPMAYNPVDTTFIQNYIGGTSYLWGIQYNIYAPLYNYFPLTINQEYRKWAGASAHADAPVYWLASNGQNGTFLIVFSRNGELVSQVTFDLGDTPWSSPVQIYQNKTAYLLDPFKVTGLKFNSFLNTFLLEMQNSKQIIQRAYDILRGYWLNDTIVLVPDRSIGKLGRVAYANGAFGDNYVKAYSDPTTGNLYVESCVPTNSPTQSPVVGVSQGTRSENLSMTVVASMFVVILAVMK